MKEEEIRRKKHPHNNNNNNKKKLSIMISAKDLDHIYDGTLIALVCSAIISTVLTIVYMHTGGLNVHFERTTVAFTVTTLFFAALAGIFMIHFAVPV